METKHRFTIKRTSTSSAYARCYWPNGRISDAIFTMSGNSAQRRKVFRALVKNLSARGAVTIGAL